MSADLVLQLALLPIQVAIFVLLYKTDKKQRQLLEHDKEIFERLRRGGF